MNILDEVFPPSELSEPESLLLVEIFSNPVVRKYLQILGANAGKELLSLPILDETPESLAKKHILVSGKLDVITTLLSIMEYQK